MKKRLLSALRWIDATTKNEGSKTAEGGVNEQVQPEEKDEGYSQAGLSEIMGSEEWFLAYEMNSNGNVEGHGENATYSLSISPDGFAKIKSYTMTGDSETGSRVTMETDCKEGSWEVERNLLTFHLADETLQFIIARIENGIAMLVDPDDGFLSVLMTEAAFKSVL